MKRACACLLGAVLLTAANCDNRDNGAASPGGAANSPPAAAPASAPSAPGDPANRPAFRAAAASSPDQMTGGRLFDGRASDGSLDDDDVVAAGFGPGRSAAGLAVYTAPAPSRGLRIDDVPEPAPATDSTNPIGALIMRFIGSARAAADNCYHAVKQVLMMAGVIDSMPEEYGGRAFEFASAYDDNVADVRTNFVETNVLSSYPFRLGTVLVWGNLNCSVSGSAAGRASGHIEIVKRLNCSDPARPSRASCPSITDRHFSTVDRTYEELSSFARMRHQRTGEPCVRAFEPRATRS